MRVKTLRSLGQSCRSPRARGSAATTLASLGLTALLMAGCGGSDGHNTGAGGGGTPSGMDSVPPQRNRIAYVGPDPLNVTSAIRLINPDGTDPRVVNANLVELGPPRWSRDGRLIAAGGVRPVGPRDPIKPNVFIFDGTGANLRQVSDLSITTGALPFAFFSAFSATAQKLAVVSLSLSTSTGVYITGQVYSLDQSRNPVILDAGLSSPFDDTGLGIDWSPTADSLVFPIGILESCPAGSLSPAVDLVEIFSAPPTPNASRTQITRTSPADLRAVCALTPGYLKISRIFPVFSPHGTQIAFVQWNKVLETVTQTSIRVINLDGRNERKVVSFDNEQSFGVSWSPDGHQLVFDRGIPLPPAAVTGMGSKGLWVINVDGCLSSGPVDPPCGTGLRQITPQGQFAWAPSWSWAR